MTANVPSSPGGPGPDAPPKDEVVSYLADRLSSPTPLFALIVGRVGSGKSLLLRSPVPRLPGLKVFLCYQQLPPSGTGGAGPSFRMVKVDAQEDRGRPAPGAEPGTPPMFAFDRTSTEELPRPLLEAASRVSAQNPSGWLIADTWDRASEAFARSQVAGPPSVEVFDVSAQQMRNMQAVLNAAENHLALTAAPEFAEAMIPEADEAVELHQVRLGESFLRVATHLRFSQAPPDSADHLYTLAGGVFHSLPCLPPGFQPPIGPPDPDPEPKEGWAWPGSSDYARAFGRMRLGSFTGLVTSKECPDLIPHIFTVPLAAHVLRSGGRVVWIPGPTFPPVRILGKLADLVPTDWIRERLRLLTASPHDPGLGELGGVVLPLRREVSSGTDLRTALAPGISPTFPEAYRFLRDAPGGGPALLLASLEGWQIATAASGTPLDARAAPVLLGAYGRIPHLIGFGYAHESNPLIEGLRTSTDTFFQVEYSCGRPVVRALTPRPAAFLLDWTDPSGRYSLLPVL